MLANQTLAESASAQAVRVAARRGTEQDINRAVERVLGSARFSKAKVYVTTTGPDGGRLKPGDPVDVRIELVAKDVVPDLLVFVGFGLGDRKLIGRASLMME